MNRKYTKYPWCIKERGHQVISIQDEEHQHESTHFTWFLHFDPLLFSDNHYAVPSQSSHSKSIHALQCFFFSTQSQQQVRAVMEQKKHNITTSNHEWISFKKVEWARYRKPHCTARSTRVHCMHRPRLCFVFHKLIILTMWIVEISIVTHANCVCVVCIEWTKLLSERKRRAEKSTIL